MSTLLIVEDEQHLADGLRFNLEAEGYTVELTSDGESALQRLRDPGRHYDAVVLDVMLPGKDGFSVARELRAAGSFLPVLMLTARGRPEDVLQGFEAGADDYLPKPFELAILLARLHGLLRRWEWARRAREGTGPARENAGGDAVFRFNGRAIDFDALELRTRDRVLPLTVMEAELLRHLVRHAGKPVTRKSILENVWNLREDTDTRAIDNFMVRLRRYIEEEPSRPRHLLTVRGVGYRFVPNPKD